MPDAGLTKALSKAVRKGASGARVFRPGEREALQVDLDAKNAKRATKGLDPVTSPKLEPVAEPPVLAPNVPEILDPDAVPPAAKVADTGPVVTPAPPEPPVRPAPVVDETQVNVDAFRMSRAQLGDFALDESYMPNFDTIKDTDGVKAVIADTALRNAGKIDEARRGVIANEQLLKLAGELDLRRDVVEKVLTRESGGVLNPETIVAARQVLSASADRLKSLADMIAAGKATDIDKVTFARQVQFHNEYQTQFMGARAETGRALNAFSIPVGSEETVAARIQEIIKGAGADVETLARAVAMTDSVAGVTKAVRVGLFRRSGRAAINLVNRNFVNGILSGPVTHAVNTLGNGLFQAMNTAEISAAARLGKFLPGDEHVQVGEALAMLHGTVSATRDAWRLAARTMRTGQTLDQVLKYETGNVRTLSILPELDKPYLRRVISGIDSFIDAPTERVLAAEDEFFKTIAYRASVERQALLHVQAQLDAGAITRADAAQAVREFMEDIPEEAQKQAEDWAREMTFQNPLGPTAQLFQTWARKIPPLTLIAPFIRTPINIFKQGVYRSPMAVFSAKFWRDVQAGGRARDLALTRFAMGSATTALIATMAMDGEITGAGPSQPEAKMLWEANGRRPYSIRVVDPDTGQPTYHSYARMEPIASVVGATADAVEILSYLNSDVETMTDEEVQIYNAAGAIIAGVMNNTGNKTFMKGTADFVELLTDPTRYARSYAMQMAVSTTLPYSSLLRTIRNTQDPYLREAWTILDKYRDTIPGYSEKLPPRRGLFGEVREKNSSTLLGTMSPMPESPEKYDRVTAKLADLMNQTKLVPITMPHKEAQGMRLRADEYEHLVRISRTQPIFNGGTQTFKDKLAEVMDSEVYANAEPVMRVELLKQVQRVADDAGRALLAEQNPQFAARLERHNAKRNRLRFGEIE